MGAVSRFMGVRWRTLSLFYLATRWVAFAHIVMPVTIVMASHQMLLRINIHSRKISRQAHLNQ